MTEPCDPLGWRFEDFARACSCNGRDHKLLHGAVIRVAANYRRQSENRWLVDLGKIDIEEYLYNVIATWRDQYLSGTLEWRHWSRLQFRTVRSEIDTFVFEAHHKQQLDRAFNSDPPEITTPGDTHA